MDLKKHKERYLKNRKKFRAFISEMEEADLSAVTGEALKANEEVWQEIDCTTCANCCKTMTPTLDKNDIERISKYLHLETDQFKMKYLIYDREEKDWRMQKQPCVFLDQETNLCNIYEVRPEDCQSFPHLVKQPLDHYVYIHNQNIRYCPATYLWVKKMMKKIEIN